MLKFANAFANSIKIALFCQNYEPNLTSLGYRGKHAGEVSEVSERKLDREETKVQKQGRGMMLMVMMIMMMVIIVKK